MDVIETRHLKKIFSSGLLNRIDVRALDDVSIRVHRGEIFGLLGPNGAGKTTFVRILLGIIFPTSGDASIFGEPVSHYWIKQKIGFLPENHRYPVHFSGEGVLRYFGTLSGMDRAALSKRIDDLLHLVNMKQWRGIKLRKYSKGMLQRIGLAQALINEPDLIFLDEPTDGVDPIGRKEIRDVLKRLRDQGKTIFLNSHLLSEVEIISDRVAILKHGKVIKCGRTDEFTTMAHDYEIDYDGSLNNGLIEKIKAIDSSSRIDEGRLYIASDSKENVNSILDILRSEGVIVKSMSQRKSTLEDSFINLINEEPGR
jgi:ABC-2 type transport system ATP-binding protein